MTLTEVGELRLKGVALSQGIGIGHLFLFGSRLTDEHCSSSAFSSVAQEIDRYLMAVAGCKSDIWRLKEQMEQEDVAEGSAILEAHLQIVDDPSLREEVIRSIQEKQYSAEEAFQQVMSIYQARLGLLSDLFFKERLQDIQAISSRLFAHLRHTVRPSLSNVPCGAVVFANELSPYEVAEADQRRIAAFVTRFGSATSHTAIIARAKGIPYISSPDFSFVHGQEELVIVDGYSGDFIVAPSDDTLSHYQNVLCRMNERMTRLSLEKPESICMAEGEGVQLLANVEALDELYLVHSYGGMGIGLLRSESLFLGRSSLPTEEEQYRAYRQCIEQMHGLPVVIRTFDLGGDKSLMRHAHGEREPFFIGCRAFRSLLHESAILKRQIRAILRASAIGGRVKLLFPMVTSLSDLREAKELIKEARVEIQAEIGKELAPLQVGAMIEVPAAAMIVDLFAEECDFLAIGTNDLTHYSLATERTYQATSHEHSLCHPALLRMIETIVNSAKACAVPLSICGEVAADPRFIPLLLGLGIRSFSVASRHIPIIKEAICRTRHAAAVQLAEDIRCLKTAAEVHALLSEVHCKAMPECDILEHP